jgi:hypothetical protein
MNLKTGPQYKEDSGFVVEVQEGGAESLRKIGAKAAEGEAEVKKRCRALKREADCRIQKSKLTRSRYLEG